MPKSKVVIHTPGREQGTAKLWFIYPDIHFPDHDEEALEVALAAARVLKPETSLLLGDVLDCDVFSSHAKRTIPTDSAENFYEQEVVPCNKFLDKVQDTTAGDTIYLEGNHEQRIERWAVNNGPVGKSIYTTISPKHNLLTVPKRSKFKMIPYELPDGNRMAHVQIAPHSPKMVTGGLVGIHGWSHATHAARTHLQLSRSQSIVFGHVHRQQSVTSRDPWTGSIIKSFCPGTLSKLQPMYAHGGTPSEWSHGFALVYVGQHSWTEYNVSIVKGRCVLPDGREVKL